MNIESVSLQKILFIDVIFNLWSAIAVAADVSFDMRHQDNVFFLETNQNSSTFSGEDITELGLRMTLSSNDETWTIGSFGQNITDERTMTQLAALSGYPNAAANESSKWSFDFIYHF